MTGLGIGANTAAFSVVDHVLLRPFSFLNSDRLVQLWQRNAVYARVELSPPNFYDWRRLSTSFEGMSAYAPFSWNFVGEGDPRRLEGSAVTPEFFQVLGVTPLMGRTFSADDAQPRAPRTVVVSYAFWQNVFGGRADILGKTVRLDNYSYPVIGVMPRDFVFPSRTGQLWVLLVLGDPPTDARDNLYLRAMAKLKPGIGIEQARSEMRVIAEQLAREYPKENEKVGAGVDPLSDQVSNQTGLLLWALFGASACVLLIACTNLANLLLAKGIGRRKELAVRAALGAGRERLVRQLLTESLALALAGGMFGLIIATVALPLLSAIIPQSLPVRDVTTLDSRVLLFAILVTLATGLVFGVLPALRASRGVAQERLAEGSRSGVGGRRERLRSILVTAEIAVSLVLLIRLVVAFAALCVVLAGVGIHGLLSFTVGQRAAEFGVRIALGAQARDILLIVLRDGIIMAAIGGVFGALLSYAAGRSMEALLAGISPFDPTTLVIAAVVAFGMTLSGSLVPALRAMRIDPTNAFRMSG